MSDKRGHAFARLTFRAIYPENLLKRWLWKLLRIPPRVALVKSELPVKDATPYKGAFHGELTTLSVPLDEYDGGFDDE